MPTYILTEDQRKLLGLLLEHNDTETVEFEFESQLFEVEKKQYIDAAGGNQAVLNDWLLEQLEAKTRKDAKSALPALGDAIIAFGRAIGGRSKIVKKEEAGA